MLQTAWLLPQKGFRRWASTRPVSRPEPPACYRASWQLPGRDSHPLATTSLCWITIYISTSNPGHTAGSEQADRSPTRGAPNLPPECNSAALPGGRHCYATRPVTISARPSPMALPLSHSSGRATLQSLAAPQWESGLLGVRSTAIPRAPVDPAGEKRNGQRVEADALRSGFSDERSS
jgi:hypothetical protein